MAIACPLPKKTAPLAKPRCQHRTLVPHSKKSQKERGAHHERGREDLPRHAPGQLVLIQHELFEGRWEGPVRRDAAQAGRDGRGGNAVGLPLTRAIQHGCAPRPSTSSAAQARRHAAAPAGQPVLVEIKVSQGGRQLERRDGAGELVVLRRGTRAFTPLSGVLQALCSAGRCNAGTAAEEAHRAGKLDGGLHTCARCPRHSQTGRGQRGLAGSSWRGWCRGWRWSTCAGGQHRAARAKKGQPQRQQTDGRRQCSCSQSHGTPPCPCQATHMLKTVRLEGST